MFFRRLFGRKEKPVAEPMHGSPALQTDAEQQATRERMLAEMAADRERLAAKEARAGSESPDGKDTEPGATDDA